MMTVEEYKLCRDAFKDLFYYASDNGHIDDVLFESHGIPCDLDPFGNVFVRRAGIRQKPQQ